MNGGCEGRTTAAREREETNDPSEDSDSDGAPSADHEGEWDESNGGTELFDLLSDPTTRDILHAVDREPLSAKQLAERCDVSGPTAYRKLDSLLSHDLVTTETVLDDGGNHYTVYENDVESIHISMNPTEDEIAVEITHRTKTDQFIDLWEGLKNR